LIYKNGYTEGQHIFNLKYNTDNLTRNYRFFKLILFSMTRYILPYLISKIENFILKYNADYESDFERGNVKKWNPLYRNILNSFSKIIKFAKLAYSILNLFNFLNFISTNKFPYLLNRIFNFDYVIYFFYDINNINTQNII